EHSQLLLVSVPGRGRQVGVEQFDRDILTGDTVARSVHGGAATRSDHVAQHVAGAEDRRRYGRQDRPGCGPGFSIVAQLCFPTVHRRSSLRFPARTSLGFSRADRKWCHRRKPRSTTIVPCHAGVMLAQRTSLTRMGYSIRVIGRETITVRTYSDTPAQLLIPVSEKNS